MWSTTARCCAIEMRTERRHRQVDSQRADPRSNVRVEQQPVGGACASGSKWLRTGGAGHCSGHSGHSGGGVTLARTALRRLARPRRVAQALEITIKVIAKGVIGISARACFCSKFSECGRLMRHCMGVVLHPAFALRHGSVLKQHRQSGLGPFSIQLGLFLLRTQSCSPGEGSAAILFQTAERALHRAVPPSRQTP